MRHTPDRFAGAWCWSDRRGEVEARFIGKGAVSDLETALRAQLPAGIEPAWLRQIHSDRVVEVRAGLAGEGDALLARGGGWGLAVVTADCVPVLLAGCESTAAVHAGWRGIAARIVPIALARLGEPAHRVTAWIGPAIGRCCYEVGDDVAAQVAAVSHDGVVETRPLSRPHLDLAAAVTAQLETHGVAEIRRVDLCTRCSEELLWSYRRDGQTAGRNLALIWR